MGGRFNNRNPEHNHTPTAWLVCCPHRSNGLSPGGGSRRRGNPPIQLLLQTKLGPHKEPSRTEYIILDQKTTHHICPIAQKDPREDALGSLFGPLLWAKLAIIAQPEAFCAACEEWGNTKGLRHLTLKTREKPGSIDANDLRAILISIGNNTDLYTATKEKKSPLAEGRQPIAEGKQTSARQKQQALLEIGQTLLSACDKKLPPELDDVMDIFLRECIVNGAKKGTQNASLPQQTQRWFINMFYDILVHLDYAKKIVGPPTRDPVDYPVYGMFRMYQDMVQETVALAGRSIAISGFFGTSYTRVPVRVVVDAIVASPSSIPHHRDPL